MAFESETGPDFEIDTLKNEFTGASRESNEPPGPNEAICLISYEITVILLGAGPEQRSGFWKAYRRELAYNQKSNYHNYHISLCQNQLTSLKMDLKAPVYFRDQRLTTPLNRP